MAKIIGVRFRNNGRVYFFDPGLLTVNEGNSVVVETAHGIELGYVSRGISEVEDSTLVAPLVPVLRVATEDDFRMREMYLAKEPEAFTICAQKILEHKLDMKLVRVEYAFNGSKLVFYFTADERVDFRDLVKDLAFQFRTRIELRQIGVRDEAKMLGGLGPCGRPICCKQFLDDFSPVSIKMAKEQNLSLSPTKISGLCGRLMCCLQYEEYAYEEMKKLMPRVGKETVTPDGLGTVLENNAITELTKVKIQLPDGSFDQKWYHYTFLHKPGEVPAESVAQANPLSEETTAPKEKVETVSGTEKTAVAAPNVSRTEKRQRGNTRQRFDKPTSRKESVNPPAEQNSASNEKNVNAPERDKSMPERKHTRRFPKPGTNTDNEQGTAGKAVTESPAAPSQSADADAVKRRRHRGGRKHRPRNPDGATNNNTPQDE